MADAQKEFATLSQLLSELNANGITGLEKKNAVERFWSLLARKNKIPYSGAFELTPFCNLDCKMCYVHLNKDQMQGREILSTDQWIDIIGQAIDAGLMHADLTGGECLTHPGFCEIYQYLVSRGVQVAILTNGILLTDEMVDFLAKSPPKVVQISVYGSNVEAYKRVTGRDAFQAVVDGINRLKNAGIKISLTLTPSRYMQEDALQLLDFIRSFNVDYGINGVVIPARSDTGRNMQEYAADVDTYQVLLKKNKEYIRSEKRVEANTDFRWFKLKGLESGQGIPCASGTSTFHLNWKGEMNPCPLFSNIAVSVQKVGFATAWNYIKEMMTGFTELKECSVCEYKDICKTCPAEKCYGELDGKLNEAVCKRTKAYVEAGIIHYKNSADCDAV